MKNMKFYTQEEALDMTLGTKGSPERDEYEQKMDTFLIGEAIRQAREAKNITQEELGNMIGVQRSQVSRIEKGNNLTLATIAKVFKAMDISANLELGGIGKVALWK